MVGTIELINILNTKHFLGNLEEPSITWLHRLLYYNHLTSTSAASMLPIKWSNKGFPADNAMKYQFHSVLRDKLAATNNYI